MLQRVYYFNIRHICLTHNSIESLIDVELYKTYNKFKVKEKQESGDGFLLFL